VIDGVAEIPDEDEGIRELILRDLLPIGLAELKFVISAHQRPLGKALWSSLKTKPFPLTPFSPAETADYLRDLELSEEELRWCQKLCKGVPGYLASVRRLLAAGRSVQQIADSAPENLPDFLEIEWEREVGSSEDLQRALAAVAFGRRAFTLDELSTVLNRSLEETRALLLGCRLVEMSNEASEIRFITEAHRQFASRRLKDLKQLTINQLIDNLLRDRASENRTNLLPQYLEQVGRYDELLDVVSEEHLGNLVRQTSSIVALHRDVSLAMRTASKASRPTQVFRFALLQSAISSLVIADPWLPEMEAQIALGNLGHALSIANAANTKESRLRLLAAYARLLHEREIPVEATLRDQVVKLAHEVDFASLGISAIDIAVDLVVVAPSTAMEVIARFSGDAHVVEELDHAFLRLAIHATRFTSAGKETSDATEQAQERIKDASLKKLVVGLGVLLGRGGAQEAIRKAEQVDSAHRSFILRQWIQGNREHSEALEVVQYALDHMIRETASTTTMKDLREVALALPYATSVQKLPDLIQRFDGQKGISANLGSYEEVVRLEMLLARAEAKLDIDRAARRIASVYESILSRSDMATQADCCAWIVSAISEITSTKIHPELSALSSQAEQQLSNLLDRLLENTAEQQLVVRGALRAFSRTSVPTAVRIAARLNTRMRRDKAYAWIAHSILDLRRYEGKCTALAEVIGSISNRRLAWDIYIQSLEAIDQSQKLPSEKELLPYLRMAFTVDDAYRRAKALRYAMKITATLWPDDKRKMREFYEQIIESAEILDSSWVKAEMYFESATAVALCAADLAKDFARRAAECKARQVILGPALADLYGYVLAIAVRALSGTLTNQLLPTDHLERLKYLIDQLPSLASRATVWADLSLRCWARGARDIATTLATNHVWPAVSGIADREKSARYHALTNAAPCLYLSGTGAAHALLEQLPRDERDQAYVKICEFMLKKIPPGDPGREERGDRERIDYRQALEICEVVARISSDNAIFRVVEMLADALTDKKARDWLNRQQRVDIAERLIKIISEKLPDGENIAHDGYVIACLARAMSLRQVSSQELEKLIERAEAIPNMADRAIVIAIVGMVFPPKQVLRRQELLKKSEALIGQLPSEVDRVERYQWLANMTHFDEPVLGRRFVMLALQSTFVVRDQEKAVEYQREAIELAHRIDPDYADQLARALDDDPGKKRARAEARRHLQVLKTKKLMAEGEEVGVRNKKDASDLARAAWMNLGALNSGRIRPQKLEQLTDCMVHGAAQSLESSFRIFSWIVENANRRYGGPDRDKDVCMSLSESALATASVMQRLLMYLNDESSHQVNLADQSSGESILVKDGDHELARQVILDWIRSSVVERLTICDPYFKVESLWILKAIGIERPGCRVSILMGRGHLDETAMSVEEMFKSGWRVIADDDPPETNVVIASVGSSGKAPIHERWLLSSRSGLRIGTSLGDLGAGRTSEISSLSEQDVAIREQEVMQYIRFEKRIQGSERITYRGFSLP
jgi:tetratricopeptide (TPR) repeat protein